MGLLWLLLVSLVPASLALREATVQVNTKRILHIVSERFLSISLDPRGLAEATPLGMSTVNMAKALHPMFIRIGGPSTNDLHFDADGYGNQTSITGDQWRSCQELAREAGVDLILSLNTMQRMHGVWDSKNSLEIISFSHQNGYELAFQLGYSAWSMEGVSGVELGRDAVRLRMILDAFPRYSRAPVLAPDLSPAPSDGRFIREFLQEASPSLAALPIQMPPSKLEEEDLKPVQSVADLESMVWGVLPKSGKTPPKKPLWIAESEVAGGTMDDAMSWIRRLGIAAKAGYQVVLRQPEMSQLDKPTPDLWSSVLYKALVGREVFDARLGSGNKSAVHVFAHCTAPSLPGSIIDPAMRYERGAVTVFGINTSPDYVRLSLRMTMKEEPLHVFTLTSDHYSSKRSLFNGEELSLSSGGDLPLLYPRVRRPRRVQQASLPPRSVFFLVLPQAKARLCSVNPFLQAAEELAKKFVLPEEAKVPLRAVPQDVDYEDAEISYVRNKAKKMVSAEEQDMPVRYVTFNDDPWLGRFAESMTNLEESEPDEDQDQGSQPVIRRINKTEKRIKRSVEKQKEEPAFNLKIQRNTPEIKVALEELTEEGEKLVKTLDSSLQKEGRNRKRGLGTRCCHCDDDDDDDDDDDCDHHLHHGKMTVLDSGNHHIDTPREEILIDTIHDKRMIDDHNHSHFVEEEGMPGVEVVEGVHHIPAHVETVDEEEPGYVGTHVEEHPRYVETDVGEHPAHVGSYVEEAPEHIETIVEDVSTHEGSPIDEVPDHVGTMFQENPADYGATIGEGEVMHPMATEEEGVADGHGRQVRQEPGFPPEIKMLTGEEIRQRLEAFKEKLRESRERLESLAANPLSLPALNIQLPGLRRKRSLSNLVSVPRKFDQLAEESQSLLTRMDDFDDTDAIRTKVLSSGPRDLYSLAQRFTAMDKRRRNDNQVFENDYVIVENIRNQEPEKQSIPENREVAEEVENRNVNDYTKDGSRSDEEGKYIEESDEDWLAGAERIAPVQVIKKKEESEKKGAFIVSTLLDRIKSLVGFVKGLVTVFQKQSPDQGFD